MYGDTRERTLYAAPQFATEDGPKYPKAVTAREKDADVLLTFFDFPRRALEASLLCSSASEPISCFVDGVRREEKATSRGRGSRVTRDSPCRRSASRPSR